MLSKKTELTLLERDQHMTTGTRVRGEELEEGDLQYLTSFFKGVDRTLCLAKAAIPGRLRLTWQVLQSLGKFWGYNTCGISRK